MIRYNQRANPTPSKVRHNTLLEVVWTIVPVFILVFIAIPSFRLLYFEADIPTPDVTLKAIEGHLARAYAKLGIEGRSQLARALAAENKD